MTTNNGAILGYDPGGNGSHGVAAIKIREGRIENPVETATLNTAKCVIGWTEKFNPIVGLGVDTLTYWSTGRGGWRAADLWLREKYESVKGKVIAPGGLRGAMVLNGMSVLITLRDRHENLPITETHPKVLYTALTGCKYDYEANSNEMNEELAQYLGVNLQLKNEHEWDAAISALAAWKGISGEWNHDLLSEEAKEESRLVFPCGSVNYWWPKETRKQCTL